MKQIEYTFSGNLDRDFIDEELMEKFTIFDNPHKEPNKYIVYSETDEVPTLSDYSRSFLVDEIQFSINDDWKTKYKDAVKPFQYKDIYVTTPWGKRVNNAKNIIINPSIAFGTGDHETTMICSKNIIDYNGPKAKMFDAGTGTGILAFIALKSGFNKAVGFDIDPLAIDSSIENRDLNNISEQQVELLTTTIEDDRFKNQSYDLLVANMITTYLKMVIPHLIEMMEKNSTLILSGILDKEEKMMREYLLQFNVVILEKDTLNEWVLFKIGKR